MLYLLCLVYDLSIILYLFINTSGKETLTHYFVHAVCNLYISIYMYQTQLCIQVVFT